MRADVATSGMQAHLDTGQTTLCWCWKITRRDGVILGFTNHDRELIVGGDTYEASTGFLGTEIESQLGMSVDNMDVMGAVNSDNITELDIRAGRYANADVQLFLVNWSNPAVYLEMKVGNIGEVKRGRTLFQAEVRGLSHELQDPQGRLYGYNCDRLLGDDRCQFDFSSSTFTGTGTITTTDGKAVMVASGLDSYDSAWFSRGVLTFTSGDNNGVSREVQTHSKATSAVSLSLWEPAPFEMSPGDTFSVVAGCDKRWVTCKNKFNNSDNFRGFPHIPGPDTVIQYATNGDPLMDGGGNYLGKD